MSIVKIKATNDQSFSVKKQLMAENYAATQKFSVKVADIYICIMRIMCNASIFVTFLWESIRMMLEQIVSCWSHICNGFCPRPLQCLCNHLSSDFFQI